MAANGVERFHDKVVLITGASSGIGEELAVQLARAGARLALAARRIERLEQVRQQIVSLGAAQPLIVSCDVTRNEDPPRAVAETLERWGRLDGLLHAIGFAPQSCLGGDILRADWPDVAVALEVSAYSLKALVGAFAALLDAAGAASVVGLDFDAAVAWPAYDWMGVAKAALESLTRYLARDMGPRGVRVNLVAAGPVRTVAAKSIPAFAAFEDTWERRAPLGWDIHDATPVARACVALLSDWFPATTGEIVHVDGGVHAMGG